MRFTLCKAHWSHIETSLLLFEQQSIRWQWKYASIKDLVLCNGFSFILIFERSVALFLTFYFVAQEAVIKRVMLRPLIYFINMLLKAKSSLSCNDTERRWGSARLLKPSSSNLFRVRFSFKQGTRATKTDTDSQTKDRSTITSQHLKPLSPLTFQTAGVFSSECS